MTSEVISAIASAIEEIETDDSDDQACASFKIAGEETPWIQVVPGILNLWWPFGDDPAARLPGVLPELELCDWEAGTFATFEFAPTHAQEQAKAIDRLFQTLYDCPPDYALDVEIYVVQDEEIPDTIPVAREEGYHTDQIGCYRDGQFMGFVVATLPSPLPDDWEKHKRWYAILHLFDSQGNHDRTDHWFAGTTADGERSVVENARQRLSEMLDRLDGKAYGDVQIALFSTQIDDQEFGLVDATYEDDETDEVVVQAELRPNELVFYDPWDGTYDT